MRIVFSPLRDVKRALTIEGDIGSDIAFQNDVNTLLATISRLSAIGPPPPDLPRAVAREQLLGSTVRRARPRR